MHIAGFPHKSQAIPSYCFAALHGQLVILRAQAESGLPIPIASIVHAEKLARCLVQAEELALDLGAERQRIQQTSELSLTELDRKFLASVGIRAC